MSVERFGLQWIGKSKAVREAELPPVGALMHDETRSIDPHTTKNTFIAGDNVHVLKLLQNEYRGQVDMIYIDPPYNTGKEFVYTDRMKSHSEWLNMMYPRLVLGRELLRDDGVLFVSINEVEMHHLRCILDEIFGEENYIETFVWTKTNTPPSLSAKSRKTVEYILCYEKKRNRRPYKGELLENGDAPLLNRGNPVADLVFPIGSIKLRIADGTYTRGTYAKVELLEDVIVQNGTNATPCVLRGEFKWSQKRVDAEIGLGTYFLIKSKRFSIRYKRVDAEKYKAPTNRIERKYTEPNLDRFVGVGTNETASLELDALGLGGLFDYPKPVSLIQYLARFSVGNDALILDFFAGSGSTAAAVLALNAEDGGTRRFVCVQLPEAIDPRSQAYRAGYNVISDLTLARIERVIRGTERTPPYGGGVRVYRHVQR